MHWLSDLWFAYFWPSLKGNGPEALVQTIAYAGIGVLLIPLIRRFVRAELAASASAIADEAERVARDLRKPFRPVWRLLRKLPRVRVTVKEINAVGRAVETADPALTPAVEIAEDVTGKLVSESAAGTQASTTMQAQ